jgi:hypothetical protein
MFSREYYIYNIPVFVFGEEEPNVDVSTFCSLIEQTLPPQVMKNIEVCYISEDPILDGRNATYANGAIYMDIKEPSNEDLVENFIHETAHSLEVDRQAQIYDESLVAEFRGKRRRLYHILKSEGYDEVPEYLYDFLEYNKAFDNFLANEVGYPTLVSLTMGLFCSPYAATSVQEYFANGFEKYFTESPRYVKAISPILYQRIIDILNDDDN